MVADVVVIIETIVKDIQADQVAELAIKVVAVAQTKLHNHTAQATVTQAEYHQLPTDRVAAEQAEQGRTKAQAVVAQVVTDVKALSTVQIIIGQAAVAAHGTQEMHLLHTQVQADSVVAVAQAVAQPLLTTAVAQH
jgi:hypothetical protein